MAYGFSESQNHSLRYSLENVYEKNFYNLLDSVNTAENDLSKVLVSSGSSYQTKLLNSVAKASNEAQISVAGLPLTQSDISDMVRMVNQIYGYTSTLSDKIAKGGTLSESELATLEEVYQNVLTLKNELNSSLKTRDEVLMSTLQQQGISVVKDGKALTVRELLKKVNEITDPAVKDSLKEQLRALNFSQAIGYAYSGLILGLGIPKLNIHMTKQSEAKRKARLAALKSDSAANGQMLNNENRKFLKEFAMKGVSLS